MNWVLSAPPNHKVGHAQQYSIIEWRLCITDEAQSGPEDISKLHEEVARMPMVPTFATLPFLSQPAPMASWGIPYSQFTEEEKTLAWLTDDSHDVQAPPEVDSCSTRAPFWDIPEGQW